MGFIFLSTPTIPADQLQRVGNILEEGEWPVFIPRFYPYTNKKLEREMLAAAQELWFLTAPGWKSSPIVAEHRDWFFRWFGQHRPMRELHVDYDENGFYLAYYENLHVF